MDSDTRQRDPGRARSLLVVVGGVSAGVHAGLSPEHLHEWLPLGAAFIVAAVAAAAGITMLTLRPLSPSPPRVLAALLAGLVAAYALTRTFALPPLDPHREPLDVLGVCTTALEAAGLVIAIRLGWPRRPGRLSHPVTTGGTR
jgi:hypothetical protein